MKIVADAYIPFIKEYFAAEGELLLKPGRTISHADVIDADLLLVRSITPVNAALLAGTSVRFVGSVTAGADHLDTEWLMQAGITFAVASGFNAPPVADYVIAVIAALQQKQMLAAKQLKIALIGVGHVGQQVMARLAGLQIEVICSDPLRAEQEKEFCSLALSDIKDVDCISLHVPLTKTGAYPTHHFIDHAFLERQKPGAVLVNASRGQVIHAEDLLHYGQHLRWCLDVWPKEPHVDQELLTQAVIATPHIAGYSLQSKMRGIDMIYHLACEKNLIPHRSKPTVSMQKQRLELKHERSWQEVVLSVFDPFKMTEEMRKTLMPHTAANANLPQIFDELRNQFNHRYEFGFTMLVGAEKLSAYDQECLRGLGFEGV
jgi:erythronate-4-phosphate dehydrogenase